jgi:hypothetical protein
MHRSCFAGLLVTALATGPASASGNLLTNPDFATNVTGWSNPSPGIGSFAFSTTDAASFARSGSLRAVNQFGGGTILDVGQCVAASAGVTYELGAKVLSLPIVPPPFQFAPGLSLQAFSGPGCTGNVSLIGVIGGSGGSGEFTQLRTVADATPGGTQSVRLATRLLASQAGTVAFYDDVFLVPQGECVPDFQHVCLNQGRFEVAATWQTLQPSSGDADAVRLTSDTGYLTFFDAANVEVVVKVLDACGVNNHFWVFASGLTNVDTEITVTDTASGVTRIYNNPQNTAFQPIQDTSAFATCP